ncbi:MarR family transcriptional regulator [Streptomyces sp. SID13031]|uniref:MarR family transcriptional regulator n=1 Tax=Streptomyces sp. SID13031 TaxID=2706046 RepID=UPI0013CB6B42|nr:MarR family transcriptional regulator [Streptomyces sp. SID13031]NEA31420.1 MarR family transcriptional regulator [Streptomyces sp. SID13031]
MPGGRLTQQDRRLIATRLEEGHGYAEIARELARPTSTISREVTRNGGRAGYRAEHAQLATGSRARRRKPSTPAASTPTTDAYGRDRVTVRAYTELFADTMVETGLPRMASRVLAYLYTADSPSLTAAKLVRELQVSPASISKAISYLEGLELVRRQPAASVPGGGKRNEHYLIAEDIWIQAWRTSARANANWAGVAGKGADLFDPATPAGERLARMSQFFQQLSDDMSGLGPDPDVAEDTATLLAALIHAARPLTAEQLAKALGWPVDRVTIALTTAEAYKPFTDPLAVEQVAPRTYTVTVTRLTDAQRRALRKTT